ncbi:MAG TPA: VWA domain-containing protein [Pirellulales bacterium]|nr:VWA domain-containing protein [Pirellulales bacterium]
MSHVGRSRSAWLAALAVVGVCAQAAMVRDVVGAEAKPSTPSVWETFAKPGGPTFFALKLSPSVPQPTAAPLDLIVLFDTSASQIGAYRAKALEALRTVLGSLSANDRAALVAVDVNAVKLNDLPVAPSSEAMQRALAALDRRVPLGSTDLRAALNAALEVAAAGDEAGRTRSILYIGDGFSVANLLTFDDLKQFTERLVESRLSFNSYAIGPRVVSELLAALANHAGGMVVFDDDRSDGRKFGRYLAAVARSAVVWPAAVDFPQAVKQAYPRPVPPLRFDRDTILLGSLDSKAAEAKQPLAIKLTGDLNGKLVTLEWKLTPGASSPDNAYLARVVEAISPGKGLGLPTVGSVGLAELRRRVNLGAQALAMLGEQALAFGRPNDAAQLADAAEKLDSENVEASNVRAAAMRVRQKGGNDLSMKRAPAEKLPPAPAGRAAAEAADGELLNELERQNRVVEGFLRAEVNNALSKANAGMALDPEATRNDLKLLMDKVQQASELSTEVRAQLVSKIVATLRAANRMAILKEEQTLQRQQIVAEGEARERIVRELFLQEEKVDQIMSRFGALMDEERYRDAEALADIAEEMLPGRAGLRGAELTARMLGYQADTNAVLDMRRKGFVDALFQIELSHVPTADEPPIIYPDPEVWQLLTERRKKYKAVDLLEHGPNEMRILQALDEPTEIDFAEQPLSDVVEYLKQRHGIEIQLDEKALADAGTASDTAITRSIKGITLRSALKLLLSELDLTYVIRNEVLMITSKTEAENMLSTRVYPVGDLVIPVQSMGGRGMFNVPAEKRSGFRAFAVKDDLKMKKQDKGAKPADTSKGAGAKGAAANGKAAAKRPVGAEAPKKPVAGIGQPRPRNEKIEPIKIEFKEGADPDTAWNDYFAAHTGDKAPSEASVRETVRQLMKGRKFDHVIGLLYAALRNKQGQPWMYEALALALQADQRDPEEIERVLLSALDFASNPIEVMYLAQYMSRLGLDKRALQLFRQLSKGLPAWPDPYIFGLQLAQKLDDLDAIKWATIGILSQPWPNKQIDIWDSGVNVAEATLARLKSENRTEEAEQYEKEVKEALVRDLVVIVSWTGEADVDLLVEEPGGTVCSFRMPRTLSGGIMLGDSVARSKKEERKAEGAQEAYICPKGFSGEYRIRVRRVWGKVTADKVTVKVFWHYWSKKQGEMTKQVDLSGTEAVCMVDLTDGRRTEPLEQQQLVNAVANQAAVTWQLAAQLNAMNDPGAAGSMARSRAKQPGELPRGLNPNNPFFLRGAAGYQPVIISLPQGASMFTSAVISADRRYVRVSPIPFFSAIGQVNTFNYVTGASGSSGGGGGSSGFGGSGAGGKGLGGF